LPLSVGVIRQKISSKVLTSSLPRLPHGREILAILYPCTSNVSFPTDSRMMTCGSKQFYSTPAPLPNPRPFPSCELPPDVLVNFFRRWVRDSPIFPFRTRVQKATARTTTSSFLSEVTIHLNVPLKSLHRPALFPDKQRPPGNTSIVPPLFPDGSLFAAKIPSFFSFPVDQPMLASLSLDHILDVLEGPGLLSAIPVSLFEVSDCPSCGVGRVRMLVGGSPPQLFRPPSRYALPATESLDHLQSGFFLRPGH